MTDPTPQIVIDNAHTEDNSDGKKDRHQKEKKHKGTGAKIKSFFSKIKEGAKRFAEEGVIYESRSRRLSDGSEEVTLIVAPWGKRKRGLSMGDDSENHPPPKDVIAPSTDSLKMVATWKKQGVFKEIDKYAFETPEENTKTVKTLTNYLMAGVPSEKNTQTTMSTNNNNHNIQQNTNNETSDQQLQHSITPFLKVRAIFSWIASHIAYDIELFESGGQTDVSPQQVLNTRKAVCEGYANLFRAMTTEAGFTCWKVGGQVTGSSFISGLDTSEADTAHAWNAIQIHGEYYLVDSTWGAGYVRNHKFVRSFCPYFFLTPPQELIYTHFPDWPKWQLLETPLSKQQFNELPLLFSYFFERGLKMRSHKKGKLGVVALGETITLTLSAPNNVLFVASLYEMSKEHEESNEIQKKEHKRFVFVQLASDPQERQQLDENEELFEFQIRAPHSGKFRVEIFTKLRENPTNSFDLTIEYLLECTQTSLASPRSNNNNNNNNNNNLSPSIVNEPKRIPQSPIPKLPPPIPPRRRSNESATLTIPSHVLPQNPLSRQTRERSPSPPPRLREGKPIPFPKQYGNFEDKGHTLISPFDGVLERNVPYRFVVAKGKALKMDLVINSQKKQFLPMKLVHDHFELEHVVKEGPIQVCAQYDPKRTDWVVLLEYDVLD